MKNEVSRREFLANSTRYAAGIATGIAGLKLLEPESALGQSTWTWPWPYAAVDPEQARILGHDLFWSGKACSAGAFGAILTQLQSTVGEPFTLIPMEVLLFGHGGAAGWGTICGALNGAAAMISLVCDKPTSDQLINELIGWYTQTEFPTDISNQYAVNHVFGNNQCDIELPQNLCGSPLCHISVTEWCLFAGYKVGDIERKERCGRIAGDVAAYAVKILNDNLAGQFTPQYVPPASIAGCMSCHGSGFMDNVAAKMECMQCHGDPHSPNAIQQISPAPKDFKLSQNYPNPFNPATKIEFSLPKSENVNLSVYDIRGRLVKTLLDERAYTPGTYVMDWDGTDNFGKQVANGIYFYKIQAGKFAQTKKMTLVK